MTIWLLALVLLAALAAVGYTQGAIRVCFSLAGLLLGALLAMPLARFGKLILPPLGVTHPLLVWALAPFIVFVVVQILFRIVGQLAHQKVEVYYKYKAGDLRLSLWGRLNRRLGACLGLINGAIYLVLISVVVYPFSYLTVQMATGGQDSKLVRLLNQMGRDLTTTGLAKVVAAVNPVPAVYYDVTDILGLLFTDVRVQGRLARYPLYMHLAEEPLFKQISEDRTFAEVFVKREPLGAVLANANLQTLRNDTALQERIWDMTLPNLADLRAYLETGKSAKYDGEKILGRWSFDSHSAILALKRSNQNLTTAQMAQLQAFFYPALERAKFVAYPDNKAVIRGYVKFNWAARPPVAAPGVAPTAGNLVSDPQNLDGRWENEDGKHHLTFSDRNNNLLLDALIEGDRLTLAGDGKEVTPLVFERD